MKTLLEGIEERKQEVLLVIGKLESALEKGHPASRTLSFPLMYLTGLCKNRVKSLLSMREAYARLARGSLRAEWRNGSYTAA